MDSFIVYCSPAGSTRKIVGLIEKTLINEGHTVYSVDLDSRKDVSSLIASIHNAREYCLFIGSPVYVYHAVPLIAEFISGLPQTTSGYAVPFVTWGCATSGIALYEMGTMLAEKGYRILGAAAIPAVHSLLWQSEHPLGEGRPDKTDEALIQAFLISVCWKISSGTVLPFPLAKLNYHPKEIQDAMQKLTLEAVKDVLPQKVVNKDLCTQCGVCTSICPAAAITNDPYPVFGKTCFLCYNCMRLCPERAISADLSQMEAQIIKRAEQCIEQPIVRTFY